MSEVLLPSSDTEEDATEESEEEALNEIPASLLSYFEASRRRAAACEKLILEDLEYLTAAQCNERAMQENLTLVDKDTRAINEMADTSDEQNEDNSASSGSHADEQEFSAVPYDRQDAGVSELQQDMECRRRAEQDFEEELQRMMEVEKLRQREADTMELKAQEELEREFRHQQVGLVEKNEEELLNDMKRRVEQEVKKREEEQRCMAQRQKEEEEEEKKRKRQNEERRQRVERKLKEEEEKRKEAERKQIEAEDERRKKEEDDKRRKETEKKLKDEVEMTQSKEEDDNKMKQIEEEDKKKMKREEVEAWMDETEEEERMKREEEEERQKQMQKEMRMEKEEGKRRNKADGKLKEENQIMRKQKEKKEKVEEEEVWRIKMGGVEKREEEEEEEINQEEREKRKKSIKVMQIEKEVMRKQEEKNERSKKEVSGRLQEEEKRRPVDKEESGKKETKGNQTEEEEMREQESVKKEEEEKRRKGEEEEKMHKQIEEEVDKRVTVEVKELEQEGEKKRQRRRIKEQEEEGMKKMEFTQNKEKKKKTEDEDGRMKRDEAEIRSPEIEEGEMRGKEVVRKKEEETKIKEREEKRSIEVDRMSKEKTRNEDDMMRTNEEEERWREGKEEQRTEEVEKKKQSEEVEKSSDLQRKWRKSVGKDIRTLNELKKKESEVRNTTGENEKVLEEEKGEEQRLKQEDEKTSRRWEEEERRNKQKRDERTGKNEENEEPLRKNQRERDSRNSRNETGKNIQENIDMNIQQNISENIRLNFHGNINQNIQENIHENINKKNIPQNSHQHIPENFQENAHENHHYNIQENIHQTVHKNNHRNPSCQTCLSQVMGQRRLSWMKVRVLWSEMQNRCRRRSSVGSRRESRSSGQDGNLPPLCTEMLLRAAGRRSLQEVTILVLEDLPGCSLSTLAQCAGLQSLTLRRCGLKVLEGIGQLADLYYIDVQENNISRMDCENMTGLRVLKMSHNQLTFIHGLSGAENLNVLELSHNSITRVAGLGPLRRLQRLSLDHNQLVSTKGLRDVCTLLHLDCSHNHLAGVVGLESNVLLRTLDLTSNGLTEPPALHDHVLLGELHMDDNSLASLSRLLAASWLPHLHTLTLAHNRLTQLPDMSVAVSLTNLDLRFNCLSDLQNVCHSLEGCCSLDEVHLAGNPLQRESSWRCTLQTAVSSLRTIDGTNADVHLTHSAVAQQMDSTSDGLLSLIRTQRQQISDLQQQQRIEQLSESSHPLDGIKLSCGHLSPDLCLAEEQRRALECAHIGQTSASQATLEETLDEVSPVASSSGSATSFCDANASAVNGTRSSVQMTSCHQNWDLVKSSVASEAGGGKATDERNPESAVLRSNFAQHQAATIIQARWRGFTLRRRLTAALAAVTSLQGDDDASEVVDMEEFVLAEAMLEQGWTLREDAPARCSSESKQPLFWQPTGFYPEPSQCVLPPLPTRRLTQAWEVKEREGVSPQSSNMKKSPSTSVASDFSERSERILEEWGFTNRHTAELMLRRAQKMKSQRKSTGPSRHLDAWRSQPLTTFQLEAPIRLTRRSRSATRVHQAEAGLGRARWDRTREWLQNQNTLRHSESEHFLPDISADALSGGRRRQLALEAGRTEHHATGARACNSLPAQACRENKNTFTFAADSKQDVPTVWRKERISFRDEPVRRSSGWGGGKKRQKVKH
ncbi:uncharacterized protein lrriq1 isoform X2 [Festucalex cinctus]